MISSVMPKKTTLLRRMALAMTVLALPLAAHAHAGHAHGGFESGFMHPIGGLDHLLAMIAVGLWAVQLGKRALWALPLMFVGAMVAGGLLGLTGMNVPGVELVIALSAVALGGLVALRKKAPLAGAVLVVGLFALFHGFAHGQELPAGASALTYALGFVLATAALHGVGIGLGLLPKAVQKLPIERFAGAAVLVGGLYFTYSALV